jgi:hypothetical protein
MPDPFAEKSTTWWRSEWWQRLWWSSPRTAPKRYARPVKAVCALVGFAAIGEHLDLGGKIIVGIFAMEIPSILLERWWKQRCRYEAEQLLVLPEVGSGS